MNRSADVMLDPNALEEFEMSEEEKMQKVLLSQMKSAFIVTNLAYHQGMEVVHETSWWPHFCVWKVREQSVGNSCPHWIVRERSYR